MVMLTSSSLCFYGKEIPDLKGLWQNGPRLVGSITEGVQTSKVYSRESVCEYEAQPAIGGDGGLSL